MRRLVVFACTAFAFALGASPAHAAGAVERVHFSWTESSTSPSDCLPGATIAEHRDVEGTLLLHDDGETHVEMTASGTFTLTPEDPASPTYTGSYREHVAGRFVSEGDDDVPVVMTYVVTLSGAGSDGSRLRGRLTGHVTVRPDGTVTARQQTASCRVH